MAIRHWVYALSTMLLAGAGISHAAEVVAYPNAGFAAGNQTNSDTSLGMDFDVNSPIEITKLGVFDDGQNGFPNNVIVHLYNRDTQAPVASATFTPNSPGTLDGNNRFLPLSQALTLPAGFHGSIVEYNITGNAEAFHNFYHGNGSTGGNDGGGLISFVGQSRYGGAGDTYPTILDGGGTAGDSVINYEAGTFAFQAVPEPAATCLLAVGAASLMFRRRRL